MGCTYMPTVATQQAVQNHQIKYCRITLVLMAKSCVMILTEHAMKQAAMQYSCGHSADAQQTHAHTSSEHNCASLQHTIASLQ